MDLWGKTGLGKDLWYLDKNENVADTCKVVSYLMVNVPVE
jgi:hypothetical protein